MDKELEQYIKMQLSEHCVNIKDFNRYTKKVKWYYKLMMWGEKIENFFKRKRNTRYS